MAEKEKSKDQIEAEKAAKKLTENRISSLKSLAIYEGARYLKSTDVPYGSQGVSAGNSAYGQFLGSEKAEGMRKELYTSKLEQAANSGTIAQPEYTSNFEVEQNVLGLIEDARTGLTLGDLEKIVGETSPGYLKFKIPEKLKGKNTGVVEKKIQEETRKLQTEAMSYQEKVQKGEITFEEANVKINEIQKKAYKPSEEENQILQIFEALNFAYTDGAANALQRSHKMLGFNQVGKEIEERYKPKEEPKDSEKDSK